mgnify:CR=1 FL=1
MKKGIKKYLALLLLTVLSVLTFAQLALVDDLGRFVKFDSQVQRVVSAAPLVSDYIKYLGLEGKVVGVTDWDTSLESEKIGDMFPLNIEKIISFEEGISALKKLMDSNARIPKHECISLIHTWQR